VVGTLGTTFCAAEADDGVRNCGTERKRILLHGMGGGGGWSFGLAFGFGMVSIIIGRVA
jgi:hypothetical protein